MRKKSREFLLIKKAYLQSISFNFDMELIKNYAVMSR